MAPAGKNEERKRFGDYVRQVRTKVGADRYQFARALGVSHKTLTQVELGYQALGGAARKAVADVARKGELEVRDEDPGIYGVRASVTTEKMVAAMLDPANQERAQQLAKLLGIGIERAWVILLGELGTREKGGA